MAKRPKPLAGLVGGVRPAAAPPRRPYAASALNGATLVIPPAPPTRRGPPRPGTLAAGGAYRMRLLAGRPVPLAGGGVAYVYAAGPYTVAAPYAGLGASAGALAAGPYGPALTVYAPGGAVLPPGRGYYLRGL